MPVWMVTADEDEGWSFIAAPTRHAARHCLAGSEGCWYTETQAQRLWTDGTQGGRPRKGRAQVTVERELPGELTTKQLASIGYRICKGCEYVRNDVDATGYCEGCREEREEDAEFARVMAEAAAAKGGGVQ